jgi:hypothetical protein
MRDLGGSALRSTLSPGFSSPGLSERRSLNSLKVNLDTPRRSF